MKHLISAFIGIFFIGSASAALDDYFELNEELLQELNQELGISADAIWAHTDFETQDSAPIITLVIYTIEEDGMESVGSYSVLKELTRGKSDIYKTLMLQYIFTSYGEYEPSGSMRLNSYEFMDDINALFVSLDYFDGEEDSTYQQMQLLQWSDDETQKCAISGEVNHRVSDYYSDSLIDALSELVVYCSIGLNAESQPDL